MTREKILLVGAGGHARSCIDVIEMGQRFNIIGLIGLSHEVGTKVFGYPVMGTDSELPKFFSDNIRALITVGHIKTPEPRMQLFNLLQQGGWVLPAIISPQAYVSPHATVGAGSIVMHGAVINAGAIVGRNCIINSKSLIEHDSIVGDHCHVATAAVINGGVRIGQGTFIGSNCTVRQSVAIGDRCIIGMGRRVVADCETGLYAPSAKELP